MDRRVALKLLGGGGVIAAIGSGVYWSTQDVKPATLSLELTLEKLKTLNLDEIVSKSTWQLSRTFDHLAQSIEFSMTGYPEMKSKVFQSTVGQVAFAVFQARGKMSHSLEEPIPGEIIVSPMSSGNEALSRLITALEHFDSFKRALKPHFAYGQLSKVEYLNAHIMHINNHFEGIHSI
jgi:hypothetical protein